MRSTNESRPSSSDKSKIDKCCKGAPDVSEVGVLGADSIDGTCGALNVNAGCCGPKYEESFLDTALCDAGTYPFNIPVGN